MIRLFVASIAVGILCGCLIAGFLHWTGPLPRNQIVLVDR